MVNNEEGVLKLFYGKNGKQDGRGWDYSIAKLSEFCDIPKKELKNAEDSFKGESMGLPLFILEIVKPLGYEVVIIHQMKRVVVIEQDCHKNMVYVSKPSKRGK